MSHISPKNLTSIGIAPRWDMIYKDALLRTGTLVYMNEITSAGHQYASPLPCLPTGCPDRSIKTQTHDPSFPLFHVSLGKETVSGEREMFGEEFVRPNVDLLDPNTPLRMFLTLEVSAGVFGGAPRVKEAEDIREREGIEEEGGRCFKVLCSALGGGFLILTGIDREGTEGVWYSVGEFSIEDNSLKSESNPDGVECCGLLVASIFRGESSDFRAFGVGRGEPGLVLEGSTLRARGRALFFRPTPFPDVFPLALALALGFGVGPSPPSQPSLPSSSSDES